MSCQIETAKNYFYQKKYKEAFKIFIKLKDYYSAGLCCLLIKKRNFAKVCWQKNHLSSPASEWGLSILDMIDLKYPRKMPSFFQTRAQLEIYLNLFIENHLVEWAQNLISNDDILYHANPESYKFIARALFANGYFDMAINYCKKTLKLYFCDPEAFLILSQCYYLKHDFANARDSVEKVLDMVPNYFPAKVFKAILVEEIEKQKNDDKN